MTTDTASTTSTDFLRTALYAGPVSVQDLQTKAIAAGLLPEGREFGQQKSFRTAAERLGIVRFQTDRSWHWRLPDGQVTDAASAAAAPASPASDEPESPAHEDHANAAGAAAQSEDAAAGAIAAPGAVAGDRPETEHDRDLRLIRAMCLSICPSARKEFLREQGRITLKLPAGAIEAAALRDHLTVPEFLQNSVLARLHQSQPAELKAAS